MKVVVTGAAGLIGRNLVPLLADVDVCAVGRGAAPKSRDASTWLDLDLASRDFAVRLPARADVVVHLAQSAHHQAFPEQALDVFNVNVGSTMQLLDWARRAGVRRFILASSGGVGANPESFYLAGKHSAELLATSYRGQFFVTVLRFFFVYGAGQRRAMLVPRLVDSIREGRSISLVGEHGVRLTPTHVSDAVAAIAAAVHTDLDATVDVAGPEVLTLRAMAETIGGKLERAPVFTSAGGTAADLTGDVALMARHLAAPQRAFASGVDDVITAWR